MVLSTNTAVLLFLSYLLTLTYAQEECLQRITQLEKRFATMEKKNTCFEQEKINKKLNAEIQDQKKEVESLRNTITELQTELAYYKKQHSDKVQSITDSTTAEFQTPIEDDVSKILLSTPYANSIHLDQQLDEANRITKVAALTKAMNISESGKNPRSGDILRRLVLPIPKAKPMTNVAFYAVTSKSNNTMNPHSAAFVFDKVHLNLGNIYDPISGLVHIHTSGLYLISVSVYGLENQNNDYFGDLYSTARRLAPLARIYVDGTDGVKEGFYTVVTYVTKGEHIYVLPFVQSNFFNNGYASFSGVLIAEM